MRKKILKNFLATTDKQIKSDNFRYFELAIIITAIFGLALQYQSSKEDSEVHAWNLLNNKSVGNSGKIKALEYLAKNDEVLNNIDISCHYQGGKWQEKHQKCISGKPYLENLNLSFEYIGKKVYLQEANFSGANLYNAKFQGADLYGADFRGAKLQKVNFQNANLFGANFQNADLLNSDFTKANISGTNFTGAALAGAKFQKSNLAFANFDNSILEDANFDGANLVGARFQQAKFIKKDQFKNAYIWNNDDKDLIPTFPKSFGDVHKVIKFCDLGHNNENYKKYSSTKDLPYTEFCE